MCFDRVARVDSAVTTGEDAHLQAAKGQPTRTCPGSQKVVKTTGFPVVVVEIEGLVEMVAAPFVAGPFVVVQSVVVQSVEIVVIRQWVILQLRCPSETVSVLRGRDCPISKSADYHTLLFPL